MASRENVRGLIEELLRLDRETEWVEFKRNAADPADVGEYVSALANGAARVGKSSGYLVWGIDDETHEIVGTDFRPHAERVGNEELENWLVRALTPRVDIHFTVEELDGRTVVLLEIPCAQQAPVQFKGQEFIRIGSIKQALKAHPQVERELWRVFDRTPVERLVARPALTAAEVEKLLDIGAYYRLLSRGTPEDPEAWLRDLSVERMIRATDDGRWDVINLGAVLLGRTLSEFSGLQRKAVRVVFYEGASRVHARSEQGGSKGYAIGFEGLARYLQERLPQHEEVNVIRQTRHVYPDVAVRELVANALIHQDLSVTGAGPLIEVFDDRIEITNPGAPLVDTNRMLDVPPRSRNEGLASFMRRIGVCEERGSGVDKAVFATELSQLPAPDFRVAGDNMVATLFGPRDLAAMDRSDRVRAVYLHACLKYVSRQDVTNTSVRERFGIEDPSKASRLIAEAVEADQIKPRDPQAGRRYMSYLPAWA
ncbi:MAG: ATP-binding protein [Desertimonas sp.]